MDEKDRKAGPPEADLESFDRKLMEVHELQELTRCKAWARTHGRLLQAAATAATALESAEKMHDVVRCQSTIALAREMTAWLRQPGDDLNGMRDRYPLFTQDFPARADFDEPTGRVTVIHLGRNQAGQDAGEAEAEIDLAAEAAAAADARAAGEPDGSGTWGPRTAGDGARRARGAARRSHRQPAPGPAPELDEGQGPGPEPGDPFDD